MAKSRVHIARVQTDDFAEIDAVVKRTLGLLPLPDWNRSRKVYVKVNGICQSRPEEGYDTHPQVAVSVAEWFRSHGFDCLIGENGGRRLLSHTGVTQLADSGGIAIHDPLTDLVERPLPGGLLLKKTLISRTVLESHVVSIPKMKTHLEAVMSLSLKNLKGCVGGRLKGQPEDERIRYHRIGMSECIADVASVIRPRLAVVDAIRAMEGIGPGRAMSHIRRLGLVVAGYDAVAVDAVCCRIAGVDPREVKHITLAARHGLGTAKAGEIDVTGLSLESVIVDDYRLPPLSADKISPVGGVEVLLGKPCSNCISALATALMMLRDEGFALPERSLQLVAGPDPLLEERSTEGRLFLGRCLKDKAADGEHVTGCPPAASFIVEAVKRFERQRGPALEKPRAGKGS
jgi:uncharacterized protein (DUF362 family)